MRRHTAIATALALAFAAAPLRAELRYTMHVEARPSTVKTAVDPTMAMVAPMILQTMLPQGATEVTCVVGPNGARLQATKEMPLMPAGTYMLVHPDGTAVVVRTSDKTFWKVTSPDLAGTLPGQPAVKETKTGQKATIAGVPTERIGMEIRIPVPKPAGMDMPANMPKDFVINADKWITFQFDDKYHSMLGVAGRMMGFSSPSGAGADKNGGAGFVMRQILRGSMFGDQEVEMLVTKIADGPDSKDGWTVPAGFKEVPAPAGRIGGAR
jgi:hypothetical protein